MTAAGKPETGTTANPSQPPLYSSIDEILAFDQEFWEITKGLPIRTGSILRVPSSEYGRWGIQLTDGNRAELSRISDDFRKKDFRERQADGHIRFEEKTPFSLSVRGSMARSIGYIARQLLGDRNDGEREFHVLDLACGSGQASAAIANAMRSSYETEELIERTVFHLVDYSWTMLQAAKSGLEVFMPKGVRIYNTWDDEFLSETEDRFDLAVSMCHFHKKPFPDIFRKVHDVLVDNGALVSGDWHSVLCDHPYFVYKLLERLGVEYSRLDAYMKLFGDRLNPVSYPEMLSEEVIALNQHQNHWADVYQKMLMRPGISRDRRHFILGAFDTTRNRVLKLEQAGFTTDQDKIRAAFPRARLPMNPKPMARDSDRASVITAIRAAKG